MQAEARLLCEGIASDVPSQAPPTTSFLICAIWYLGRNNGGGLPLLRLRKAQPGETFDGKDTAGKGQPAKGTRAEGSKRAEYLRQRLPETSMVCFQLKLGQTRGGRLALQGCCFGAGRNWVILRIEMGIDGM